MIRYTDEMYKIAYCFSYLVKSLIYVIYVIYVNLSFMRDSPLQVVALCQVLFTSGAYVHQLVH